MTTTRGRVWLVGAGPGDPGLLTRRGAEVLGTADVVVHDRFANAVLLDLAPPSAERISVGKAPGNVEMDQDAINALLVEHGKAGRRVVRLKGGDPFVFGRGGEEAEALAAAGVAFEVVPGITSAIAAPAYAGIPVTHRGLSTHVTVVTGHEDPAKGHADVDWEALAGAGGTLVILMGAARVSDIAARLIAGGRAPDDAGCRGSQRHAAGPADGPCDARDDRRRRRAGTGGDRRRRGGGARSLLVRVAPAVLAAHRRDARARAGERAPRPTRCARSRCARAPRHPGRARRVHRPGPRRVLVARVHVGERCRGVLRSRPRPARSRCPGARAAAGGGDRARNGGGVLGTGDHAGSRAGALRRRVARRGVPRTRGCGGPRPARPRRGRTRRAARGSRITRLLGRRARGVPDGARRSRPCRARGGSCRHGRRDHVHVVVDRRQLL